MTKYWIGVASLDHVKIGESQGFCQLCHGKGTPLNRMKKGDWMIYYSSKTALNKAEKCQVFSAVGQIESDKAYPFIINENFTPYRKDMSFLKNVKPVNLTEIRSHPIWMKERSKLRFGHFEIPKELFQFIYNRMI